MDNSANNTKKAIDEGKLPPIHTPSDPKETAHSNNSSSNVGHKGRVTVLYSKMPVDDNFDLEQDNNDKRATVVTKICKMKKNHKKKTHNFR